jgi:hypothetical protein
LLTENVGDLQIIGDLVDARSPREPQPSAESEAPPEAD